MLALVAGVQLLAMSPWFTASALAPLLTERWQVPATALGALTSAVQLGFVVGTAFAVLFNLADLILARVYVGLACLGAAAANATLLATDSYEWALAGRFATGFFLAGVYPPAMKMVATWFASRRGLAIGTVVGALIAGKAMPWAVRALWPEDPRAAVSATSLAAALGGLVLLTTYRDGPHTFSRPRFSWALASTLVRHRPTRLAIGGYLGHMWELYAMWTWLPAFAVASLVAGGHDVALGPKIAWISIAAGGVGSIAGGALADRWGRDRWVNLCMAISGACCVLAGVAFGMEPLWLGVIGIVWGVFVVADSAQFSALVTEVAPHHAVGTALTLQTSIGFLLTMVTIELVPRLAELWGWQWAFPVLALGPAAGIACIRAWRTSVPS
jgi:MFS family permease